MREALSLNSERRKDMVSCMIEVVNEVKREKDFKKRKSRKRELNEHSKFQKATLNRI